MKILFAAAVIIAGLICLPLIVFFGMFFLGSIGLIHAATQTGW